MSLLAKHVGNVEIQTTPYFLLLLPLLLCRCIRHAGGRCGSQYIQCCRGLSRRSNRQPGRWFPCYQNGKLRASNGVYGCFPACRWADDARPLGVGALAQQGPGTRFYSWVLVHLLVEGVQSVQDLKKYKKCWMCALNS